MILHCATPVTVRGTPWAVSTPSHIGFNVITSSDSRCTSVTSHHAQAQPPTIVRFFVEPQHPPVEWWKIEISWKSVLGWFCFNHFVDYRSEINFLWQLIRNSEWEIHNQTFQFNSLVSLECGMRFLRFIHSSPKNFIKLTTETLHSYSFHLCNTLPLLNKNFYETYHWNSTLLLVSFTQYSPYIWVSWLRYVWICNSKWKIFSKLLFITNATWL